jgi:FdhD protein
MQAHTVVRSSPSGVVSTDSWGIAVEAPVAITINDAPWTVMLATPADLEDLAVGLAITEQIVPRAAVITSIAVAEALGEYTVQLHALPAHINAHALHARSLLGNTACGLCGIESLASLHERRSNSLSTEPVDDGAIRRALEQLADYQPLNAATRSVHAAAWCSMQGDILHVREDVGRHNALDKLVGAVQRAGTPHARGFVVMSSRCSYELVYKAVALEAQLLATVSAPTTMALQWSRQLGMPLASTMGRSGSLEIVRFPGDMLGAAMPLADVALVRHD